MTEPNTAAPLTALVPMIEFHVKDPDGYTLMIAQAGESTP